MKLRILTILLILTMSLGSVAGAGVISPGDIDGLTVWLDGDDIDGDGTVEGALEDGLVNGKVSAWVDKTGNGYDAGQSTEANMPIYASASLNGKGTLAFDGGADGGNDYFDIAWTPMVSHSIFIVFNVDNPQLNSWSALVSLNTGGVSTNYRSPHIFLRSSGQVGISYTSNLGSHEAMNLPGWTAGWHTMCTRHQNGDIAIGSQDGRVAWFTGAFSQDPVIKSFDVIGCDNSYRGMTGSIAEIIVYNRGLSDQEHNLIGYYLETKYGLDTEFVEAAVPVGIVVPSDGDTSVYEYQTTSDSFDIELLSAPSADVTVTVSYDDPNDAADISFSPSSVVFPAASWQQAQTITVTAVQDTEMEDLEYAQLNFSLSSTDENFTDEKGLIWPTTAAIEDDDTPSIKIESVGDWMAVSEQEVLPVTNKFTVQLLGMPSDDVAITLSDRDIYGDPGQLSFDKLVLTFTSANFNIAQTVEVSAIDDSSAEPDPHTAYVVFEVASADAGYDGYEMDDLTVSITDNDCGNGPFHSGDINEDCVVDLQDLALVAGQWMSCTTPNVPGCN